MSEMVERVAKRLEEISPHMNLLQSLRVRELAREAIAAIRDRDWETGRS